MTATLLLCTLLSVTDGDTLRLSCPDTIRVRIANIDAPERDACPGPAAHATAALRAFTEGKTLYVQPLYTDRYGRIVGRITTPAGDDIGDWLLAEGLVQPWPHDGRGRALTKKPRGC